MPRNIVGIVVLTLTPIVVNILLLVPVLVVYPYQAAAEGQDLAEGNEHAVVYLAQGWAEEAR